MNKKGFTLAELLGVLVILAILATLVTPITVNLITSSKTNINDSQKELIISYAKLWQTENDNLISDEINSVYKLYVDDMQKGGYIENRDIVNVVTGNNMVNACVKITTGEYKYTYEFVEDCGAK